MTTPNNAKLVELALRCEKATGPDHLLDRDIATALGAKWAERGPFAKGFTASLDAAMTLVPEGMGYQLTRQSLAVSAAFVGPFREDPGAWIYDLCGTTHGEVATPALALCAAALRARAATCS